MPVHLTAWMSLGLLSTLLATGAADCSGKQALLEPLPSPVSWPSECIMACTWKTYVRKQLLKDQRNIRILDSTEGKPWEYCWSGELDCSVGERFQSAYVIVPVDFSAPGYGQMEVTTSTSTLAVYNNHTTIPDACGHRYDVTDHFSPETRMTAPFCIHLVSQLETLGDRLLKCNPYLATFWLRNTADLTKL